MENYKVKVGSEAESKEAQELLFDLGCGWRGVNPRNSIFIPKKLKEYFIINYEKTKDMQLSGVFDNSETLKTHKEITISELRDLVVLKRNSVGDATHTDGHYSFYVGKDKNYFFSSCDKAWRGTWKNVEILKPIEKPMKEYINKLTDGTYKLVLLDSVADGVEGLIEVPEGMNYAYKDEFNIHFTKLEMGYRDSIIVWQRETLNDKVASAEVARQEFIGAPFSDLPEVNFEAVDHFVESNVEQGVKHSHYKKDISHLDTLDIYRVTELFNPHSCGAHIAKKALCSGQRGHKGLLTDIQDIIDTAERWKEMLIEDEKAK